MRRPARTAPAAPAPLPATISSNPFTTELLLEQEHLGACVVLEDFNGDDNIDVFIVLRKEAWLYPGPLGAGRAPLASTSELPAETTTVAPRARARRMASA